MAQRGSDTGNAATLALATTGAIGNIRSIDGVEFDLAKVEDSHLGTTTFKGYIPGDLSEPGELNAEVEFDSQVAIPSRGTVETATVTLPTRANESSPATLVGTGFLTKAGFPSLANDELQVVNVTFAFDGKTGPTYTVSTTTTTAA